MGLAQFCYATHWQAVGPSNGGVSGMVYMDLDSVREEEGYRVALFLTIYGYAVPNSHDMKLDRITQETAFDCNRREFALLSTEGYFQGKKVGRSADRDGGNWKERFRAVPKDPFSQVAIDLACNSALAPQPEPQPLAADAPGSVRLPGPGGVVSGSVPGPAGH
jgi:surface-adhesin protein E